MENSLKYPIKFAVLELKEKENWQNGYEDITCAYIVSKCFIVESKIIYSSNGESKIAHKVVFPYKDIEKYRNIINNDREQVLGERAIPLYDANGCVYPYDIVFELFDDYNEANELAMQLNKKLRSSLISNLSILDKDFNEKYQKVKNDFNKELIICKKFEEQILINTENLKITKSDNQAELPKILLK